jgi:hypothetical protein
MARVERRSVVEVAVLEVASGSRSACDTHFCGNVSRVAGPLAARLAPPQDPSSVGGCGGSGGRPPHC